MLLYLYPLLALLLLGGGIALMFPKKTKTVGRIFILAGAAMAALLGWIIYAVAMMGNVRQNFYLPTVGILLVLLWILLGLGLWGKLKKKRFSLPVSSLIAAVLVTALIFQWVHVRRDRIPSMGEGEDLLTRYAPIEGNENLASLEEDSTLKFTAEIPRIDGATAMYPIYAAVAMEVFPAAVAADIPCSTTTGAYENLINGSVDMIFAGGPSKEQLKQAEQNGVELVLTPIGREAFVFFVNANNPLNNITVEQIQGIYSGKLTQWSELGVNKLGKIRAFQRDEGSGSQTALQNLMGDLPLITPPKEDVVMGMGGIISQTADYKNYANALGYSFRFYSNEMVGNNQIKLLSVEGKEPTPQNIENGSYPLASSFYAVTRSDASENTQKLLEWLTGPQGQELIKKTGYTPLN